MKKHILILLIALSSIAVRAQNEMRIVGKGEYLPSELIDKTIRDANGEVCAGLVIVSDLDGLTYTAYNEIVKTNRNPGRDLLFIQREERVVTVYKTGFAPLKIILNDYGVKLNSGEVWQLKVTGDKISSLLPITITVVPSDAKIFFDGKEAFSGKTLQTAIGTHEVTISKKGFRTINEQIEVTQQQVVFTFKLKEIDLQSISITSTPDDAKIYLDNIEKGVTNKGMFLFPSSYTLKLSKSGYLDKEEKIEVAEGKENKFSYTLVKNAGSLSLSVLPSDASVLINKETYSISSLIQLAPGKYKIEVSKEGYYETGETIEIELGKTVTKNYTLQPKVGKLQFSVSPPEATAELSRNGKTVQTWQGLKILKDVQVGEYDLTVKNSGYKTLKNKITIEENKTAIEDAQLIKGSDATGNMVYVEGGTYMMGSDEGDSDEKPVHRVTLNSFYIGKYEVTQKEWQEIMGSNPSYFKGDDLPVESVSWDDVQEYLRKLNAKTGGKYRLPTEAEWEYAARGGASTGSATALKYSGSNNIGDVAWYDGNSGSKTHTVGTKPPNELGIYDMSGNVWEWCADWYDKNYYASSPSNNPQGPSSGTYRVLRGGGLFDNDYNCRSAYRRSYDPVSHSGDVGFRVVQDL